MKIAILAHLKYPIAQPFSGGLEMHTHLLAEGLMLRGHAVTVFAAHGSRVACDLRTLCHPTGEGHGDPHKEREVAASEESAYLAMMDELAAGGFDLVHNNSLHIVPMQMAGAIGVPMITALHTPPFDPFAEAVSAAGADSAFAAVSHDLAALWSGLVADITVIPNGIDLAVFRPKPRRGVTEHAIWSGRIVPEKGLHLAIDAARIAGIPLTFAGPRNDLDYWSAEIVPRLGPDLTDLGHLAHADLAYWIAAASVAIVSPRWDEPFGLVVAEALACSTPVAAFARGAVPSLIDRHCGALARPDDPADLARAISVAMSCDRRLCRAHAERCFDVERMIDGYEALYEIERVRDVVQRAQLASDDENVEAMV